jgi:hypothetical protein
MNFDFTSRPSTGHTQRPGFRQPSSTSTKPDSILASFLGVSEADVPALVSALAAGAFASTDNAWSTALPAPSSVAAKVVAALVGLTANQSTSGPSPLGLLAPLYPLSKKVAEIVKNIHLEYGELGPDDLLRVKALLYAAPEAQIGSADAAWIHTQAVTETRLSDRSHPVLEKLIAL